MIFVRCRVCGREVKVESWSREYERLKASDDPVYVCDPCQEHIRVDAQNQQPR